MKSAFTSLLRATAFLIIGGFIGFWLSDTIKDARLMFSAASTQSTASAAWKDFAQRIEAVGNRILEDDFANTTDRDRAEGIRQLAHVIVDGLRWEFDNASPEFTGLLVNNTDTSGWGGPNVDNKYLRGRIDGESTYILTGNIAGLEDIAIQSSKGDLHMGQIGASATLDLSSLLVSDNGDFTIIISPEQQQGNWIKQGEDHTILSIRAYYYDWTKHSDGKFYLVKDGNQGLAPSPLTEAEAAQRLANATHWIETGLVGWDKWLKLALSGAQDNVANGPRTVGGGSSTLLYGSVPFAMKADQAMIIELENPQASYYSYQTYTYSWFDAGDYANRQTSLNHTQTRTDSDGKIRYIASVKDPGVANWIDLEGRSKGMITFRYMNANNPQQPEVTVVPLSELPSHLPADTAIVSKDERRSTIAIRQKHVQHRFHN
jgi:hypothetical protein